MIIGQRIKYFRTLRKITQKQLGMAIGFTENTADVRIAQYESGNRTPKRKMIRDIASVLGVCPQAITVPKIESSFGLAHTFFAFEDMCGIKIIKIDGVPFLTLDSKNKSFLYLSALWNDWSKEFDRMRNGEISEFDYNNWRYNYYEIPYQQAK